jgi:hypothetical protein
MRAFQFQANDVAAFAGYGAGFARVSITVLLMLQSQAPVRQVIQEQFYLEARTGMSLQ